MLDLDRGADRLWRPEAQRPVEGQITRPVTCHRRKGRQRALVVDGFVRDEFEDTTKAPLQGW